MASLVEGNSVRATCHTTGAALSEGLCASIRMSTRGNCPACIQCDKFWGFYYAKEKNVSEELKGARLFFDVGSGQPLLTRTASSLCPSAGGHSTDIRKEVHRRLRQPPQRFQICWIRNDRTTGGRYDDDSSC